MARGRREEAGGGAAGRGVGPAEGRARESQVQSVNGERGSGSKDRRHGVTAESERRDESHSK